MKKLTMERTFQAPIEKIWAAFTTAEKLKKWWSPPGFSATDISVDFRKDGIFRYCFKGPENQAFWGRGVYQTLNPPTFLSWKDTFTDPQGNPVPSSHYGIPGDDIIETMVEFTFTVENNVTKMIMVGENPYDDSMLESMEQGWKGMFDNLDTLLKNEQ